jgi:hypothetical protein
MRISLLVLLACCALAALPSTAVAKGISGVDVCGAAGCSAVAPALFHAALVDGKPFGAPVAAAPFVTVEVKYRHHAGGSGAATTIDRFTYLPSLGLVRPQGSGQWIELYPVRRAELDKIVAPVELLPAARLDGVAQPDVRPPDGGTSRWLVGGAAGAALLLLALLGRYALGAVRTRPRPAG